MFALVATGTVGAELDLTATADSGLTVSFTSSNPNVASIGSGADAGKLVLLTAGTAIITASQRGDDTYAAAPDVTRTITVETVGSQSQVITFTLPTAGMLDAKLDLNAMADSGLPVSYASSNPDVASIGTGVDAGKLVLNALGTATITVSQAGNPTYEAATPVMQTIMVETEVSVVLGLEEPNDDFVLYPNPTSGKLHFSEQVAEFRLYSVEGRLLETWKNVRSVDLTARHAGLYFVEVIRGGRSVRYRIMRE